MMQSRLPSPARLGLTTTATSSSPSLPPNPNPNANPNPSPAPPSNANPNPNASAKASTSISLLPLLPPLPRAQSLLQLMASLSTSLFELSPHRATWLASFRGSFPTFLPSTSTSTSPMPTPSVSSFKELLALFTSLQTQLFEAVAELQEILDLQDSRAALAKDAAAKDASLLAFTKKIRDAHQILDRLVDDYSDYRRDAKRPRSDNAERDPASGEYHLTLHSSLDLEEVLSYAHRISYTTFAPPEHGAGAAPLRGALPPAPQENEMRASQLYHFADLDVGVPKKPLEAKERAADVLAEPLMEPTPPREELPPPMLPITVPPGWRKGMPVELPSDIPLPPPGWKPGDPITLPLDGILVGNKAEEPRASAPAPPVAMQAAQPKAPEPIQVKHVQLDIDEDYSSEYSSEVGSSEEDDEE